MFPKLHQNSRTFQEFPGLVGTMQIDTLIEMPDKKYMEILQPTILSS